MEFINLGPYRIEGILGRGGMGTVYKGVHSKSNELVAVKVIASSLANQERFRRRFAIEVETLKRLKHPNIVQLIGYGEEKGHLFYSMEYVAGESLQTILRRRGKLDWKRTINIGIEICSGLKQAHNLGIIHRDLKPANIMLNEAGQVKLTDFGIAKLFGNNDFTAAGAVIGTADFMPPEQAEGKPVTVRSDLYSLGSLCYAAIAGRPPFIGGSLPEVLYAVRYTSPISLRKLEPDTPMEVAELIDELLEKKPGDRPPTALVVGNRLQAMRVGLQNVESRPSTTSQGHSLADRAAKSNELTSIDLEGLGAESLLAEAKPTANEGSFVVLSENTGLGHSIQKPRNKIAGPDDVTRIATPSQLEVDAEDAFDPLAKARGQTRFTVVEEDERRRTLSPEPPASSDNQWLHLGSIAVLAILLIVCGIALWQLTRPPSANKLYDAIATAAESGDEGDLLSVDHEVDQFLAIYKDDPRIDDVSAIHRDQEIVRRIRRVMRRARTGGGINELDPIEQAFLDCVELRSVNAIAAEKRLQAFLVVFDSIDTLTDNQRELVETAHLVLDRVRARPEVPLNPAAEQLSQFMRWAKSNLPPKVQPKFYRGIIDLYDSKTWAAASVAEARRELMRIEGE